MLRFHVLREMSLATYNGYWTSIVHLQWVCKLMDEIRPDDKKLVMVRTRYIITRASAMNRVDEYKLLDSNHRTRSI